MAIVSSNKTEDEQSEQRSQSAGRARWKPILSSGLTVVGVACAAAYTSRESADKAVGIAAWVAVAVVGAASMIATARNAARHTPSEVDDRDD